MVDDTTILTSTVPARAPNVAETWVKMEPRAWNLDAPIWDATDEMYITYDLEGNRADSTAPSQETWDEERSYQLTETGNGSAKYEALRALAGADPGHLSPGSQRAGTVRPEWYDGTREYPPLQADRDWADPRPGYGLGAGIDHYGNGASAIEATVAGHSDNGGGVSERPAIRSHRHCPGCTGHANTRSSFAWLLFRDAGAFFLGWLAVYTTEIPINFPQYVILVTLGVIAMGLAQPSWREYINSRDRHARGGQL